MVSSRSHNVTSSSGLETIDVLTLDTSSGQDGSGGRLKTPRRPGTSSGRSKQLKMTEFRSFLENDELPLIIESSKTGTGRRVTWTTNIDTIDYAHWLPLCIGGMQETLEPYPTFAFEAAMQLLENGVSDTRTLKCLPQVMNQIKSALGTREKEVVHRVLLLLQQLAVCDGVGEALIDHYRAILPLCNILQDKHLGTGDAVTRDMVMETLEVMEAYGTDDAMSTIQQYVPTFQSQYPSDRLVSM